MIEETQDQSGDDITILEFILETILFIVTMVVLINSIRHPKPAVE